MATKLIKEFDPSVPSNPSSVPKQNTALLLLDYQGLIVSFLGESGAQVVKVADSMREWARENQIPVIHCIIDSKTKPDESNLIATRWSKYESLLDQHPEYHEVTPGLAPSGDEKTFRRRPGIISAIWSPGLLELLEENKIRSIICCGLSTSGCLLSTVRSSADKGFIMTVVEDACFDPVPGVHDTVVNHVLPMSSHVAKAEDIQKMWKKSG